MWPLKQSIINYIIIMLRAISLFQRLLIWKWNTRNYFYYWHLCCTKVYADIKFCKKLRHFFKFYVFRNSNSWCCYNLELWHQERLCDTMQKTTSILLGLMLIASFSLTGCQLATETKANMNRCCFKCSRAKFSQKWRKYIRR